MLDHGDVLGRLTRGALHLFVAGMADQHDLQALMGKPLNLAMHLGDQGTGGINGLQTAIGGLLPHGGRHPVRGEDHRGSGRHLAEFIDEERAAGLQVLHHMTVVHNLLAHIDRRSVGLQGLFDGDHGPVDPSTVSARCSDHDSSLRHCPRLGARRLASALGCVPPGLVHQGSGNPDWAGFALRTGQRAKPVWVATASLRVWP